MSLQEYVEIVIMMIGLILSINQLIYGFKNFVNASGYIPSSLDKFRIRLISQFYGDSKGAEYLEQTINIRNHKYWGANYIFTGCGLAIICLIKIFTIVK